MDNYGFHDGNIYNLIESRYLDVRPDVDRSLQMHSSLIRRLSQERELEGHQGCVNSIAWMHQDDIRIADLVEGRSTSMLLNAYVV
ncbi:hypothetical protein BDE02_02G096000 [Populus trichocarpa]|nr:hypothetical protein BDE02_02G096000 [Populus trichocarpa]